MNNSKREIQVTIIFTHFRFQLYCLQTFCKLYRLVHLSTVLLFSVIVNNLLVFISRSLFFCQSDSIWSHLIEQKSSCSSLRLLPSLPECHIYQVNCYCFSIWKSTGSVCWFKNIFGRSEAVCFLVLSLVRAATVFLRWDPPRITGVPLGWPRCFGIHQSLAWCWLVCFVPGDIRSQMAPTYAVPSDDGLHSNHYLGK